MPSFLITVCKTVIYSEFCQKAAEGVIYVRLIPLQVFHCVELIYSCDGFVDLIAEGPGGAGQHDIAIKTYVKSDDIPLTTIWCGIHNHAAHFVQMTNLSK